MPHLTKSQPKDRRKKHPPRMILTERDLRVLRAVFEARVLSQGQLERLVFPNIDSSVARRRLALLFHHQFLDRHFLPVREGIYTSPSLYVITEKGSQALSRHFMGERFAWSRAHMSLSSYFLSHTLAISEFRVRLLLVCRQAGYEVVSWQGERDLRKEFDRVSIRTATGQDRKVAVIPDSYFVIRTPMGDQHFALELDRGTEAGKRIKAKVAAYLAWVKGGQYEKRYGTKSLRVLFVGESPRRVKSVKQFIERAGGQSRFWCATLSELTPEAILSLPIWWIAGREGQHALLPREKGSPH